LEIKINKQGEVIQFAAKAIDRMSQETNFVVLVEGRAQTVNYVRTPYRFELVLSHPELIGQRRAAQRIMAMALMDPILTTTTTNNNSNNSITNEMVESALHNALQTLMKEM
jgi:hypothetical protein